MKLLGDVRLFRDLKERRFAQFFVIYCVVGWSVMEVFAQLADREVLPELVYRVVLTLVLCGVPGAVIVTWFHGEKGHQRMPAVEKSLLTGVAVLALAASGLVIRAGTRPPPVEPAAHAATAREPWDDAARVAVLYFDVGGAGGAGGVGSAGGASAASEAELIAASLTEWLIEELRATGDLHVVSRNGSRLFRGAAAPDDSVARSLAVGTVVRGQLSMSGDQLRISVSIIDGGTGARLDSRQVEGTRAGLFDLKDALGVQVSQALEARVGSEVPRPRARSGARGFEAWALAHRAEQTAAAAGHLLADGDVHEASLWLSSADSLLAAAETLEEGWTRAMTLRGWIAYQHARLPGTERASRAAWTERGIEHAERALRQDPRDAEALELKATLLYAGAPDLAPSPEREHDLLREAEAGLREAVTAAPRRASAWASLSEVLLTRGELPQAKLAAFRAYEADPFLADANLILWRLASTSWELADPIESRRWCEEGLRRFEDDYRFRECHLKLFALPEQRPDVRAVWEHFGEYVALSPPQLAGLHEKKGMMLVAMALARADLPDSARAVASRGRADADLDPLGEVLRAEAIVRTWLGEHDEAVRLLGLHLAANPGAAAAYRKGVERGDVPWYVADLADRAAFLRLVTAG